MHVLADFLFGADEELSGIFVWEQGGVLAGLEVYGLAGDAPKTLPLPQSLRPFSSRTLPEKGGYCKAARSSPVSRNTFSRARSALNCAS